MKKKTKYNIMFGVFALLVAAIYFVLIPRASGLWNCWGNQIELGRETKFSFMFNSCVIDSGRVDSKGETIWVRAENDRGF